MTKQNKKSIEKMKKDLGIVYQLQRNIETGLTDNESEALQTFIDLGEAVIALDGIFPKNKFSTEGKWPSDQEKIIELVYEQGLRDSKLALAGKLVGLEDVIDEFMRNQHIPHIYTKESLANAIRQHLGVEVGE